MKMNWFYYAIIAMVCFSVVFLLIRRLSDLGLDSSTIYFYNSLLAAAIVLGFIFYEKISLKTSTYALVILLIISVFAVIGNIFLIKSIAQSPNPGYALAINSVQVLLVGVASIFIFKSEFTLTKVIGVILAVAGVILLGL